MFRSISIALVAVLGLALGACGATGVVSEPPVIEDRCAEVSARMRGELFYDENADSPRDVLPGRLAALEGLREDADALKTAGDEPAPKGWLTALDELADTLDSITHWQGGMGTYMLYSVTVSLHETEVDALATAATEGGLGDACTEIDDWKFFPQHEG
ncbi:hypothetical protein LX16_0219 [Stackebrandtia albiflava]|uniref:Lipoprotein n=1 Tax=Stackebrandtia albiflava TaxID=406432 RepID=A0A562V9H6_9ACTN|nr:hypothetical protein [Stackebrandtia albiflava]TWJ14534.1 hypothetical protein LX16_0219 [Stackebrandtia albiflava]